jgi:hypothetical protein
MVLASSRRLNVIDKDGDVTLPGFIGKQHVVHAAHPRLEARPHRQGRQTRESGDQVLAELKMNLEIPSAKDWLSAMKFDLENGAAAPGVLLRLHDIGRRLLRRRRGAAA